MLRMNVCSATLVLALLSASRAALPQAQAERPEPAPRVTGSVETSVLELDVVVTDKDGKPVTGLVPGDFEVRIDKRPVEITNFYERKPAAVRESAAAPASESPAPGAATAAVSDRPPRHLVLFLDRLELPEKWKSEGTFGGLKSLLRGMLGPRDDAMIVTWERSLRSALPFTSDLAALERFLDRQEALSRRLPSAPAVMDQLLDDAAWFKSLPPGAGGGGIETSQRTLAAEAYAQMKAKASALRALISTLGGLPGRKVLVHASHRFSRVAGLEFWPEGLDAQEFNAMAMVESVAEAANANGVTMYTFFPEGWNEDLPPARGLSDAAVLNEAAALQAVADRTGGTFSLGWREGPALAARVVADVDSSYSLGVAPPPGKPGRDVAVDVKTKDRRLEVRARRSVVPKSPETRVRDRVLSNLFVRDTSSRLRISLAQTAVETKKGKTTLSLPIQVPIGSLATLPSTGGEKGAFLVFVASAGADGSFSDVAQQRQPFEIARADVAKSKSGHFTYEMPVLLGAPEARVSIGVFDEIGRDAGFLLVDVSGGVATVRR